MDLLCFRRNVASHYHSFSRKCYCLSHNRARTPGNVPQSAVDDAQGHFPKKLDQRLRWAACHARVC